MKQNTKLCPYTHMQFVINKKIHCCLAEIKFYIYKEIHIIFMLLIVVLEFKDNILTENDCIENIN